MDVHGKKRKTKITHIIKW